MTSKFENPFRTSLGEHIFFNKYALSPSDTWWERCRAIVEDVCGKGYYGQYRHALMSKEEREQLIRFMYNQKLIAGGRYIYYAGRPANFYSNCFLERANEDTREEWASLVQRVTSQLMTGGGVGIDYSRLRPEGRILSRTGGQSSGPIPLMLMINEIGRNVMQGGSRRSAIYGSLNWKHEDIPKFLTIKNWDQYPIGSSGYNLSQAKSEDFNFPVPLDMTNISLNYDDDWLDLENRHLNPTFLKNVEQALTTGEPGFSFNFRDKQNETLRNALNGACKTP